MAGNLFQVSRRVQLVNDGTADLLIGIEPAANVGLEVFEAYFSTDYTATDQTALSIELLIADKDGTGTTDAALKAKIDPLNPASLQLVTKKDYSAAPSNIVVVNRWELSGFGTERWVAPSIRDVIEVPSTKGLYIRTTTPSGVGTPFLTVTITGRE